MSREAEKQTFENSVGPDGKRPVPQFHRIAYIRNDFPEKFGIPRQSGLVEELEALIVFVPEYRRPEALKGLEEYSHIWLLWEFSEAERGEWSPTVRPPRLGGNTRMGVFATRSPFRPNPIGLSSVRLERVEEHPEYGKVLRVRGADLMDGTPILDIKPYLPHVDSHPEARGGFAGRFEHYGLQVEIPEALMDRVPEQKRKALRGILANDPRPAYQKDPERVYGMSFAGMTIRFRVCGDLLTVCEILP
ncbi:MAG TPA: tRNA (N6-threonylcarbamoyladenosine(37)-N6)-methyltransferase TrmO [Candidatus Fusicatenibacter intestinigallinarum]|mgnify:FL=1|uniref:tRNA (N6-threonylcarbamoyladenosine(37)-N6)-methyltransferase TrmO n=1 Tax=Candidatus Fusicatenibacter intestinigallinarum TaxID=2838598 RepID=A0A9D2NB42_9FIRM|nr:tRNA (N6-threonylcarbamoyladenosine(37)-N6)-methyltransferase TrmO [Candidatus Fusicatenibacter intestinigallinarum]